MNPASVIDRRISSIVALWVYTRMVGVPFGLGEREPVGPWDLAAGAWELVTVGACVLLLVHPVVVARRTAMDYAWPRVAERFARLIKASLDDDAIDNDTNANAERAAG